MQRPRSLGSVVLIAAILIAAWYVLSGMFDVLHFGTGVVTAVLIALAYRSVPDTTRLNIGRALVYVPWLVWQIILSNLRVARVVLSPRMTIRPTFISQPPGVVGDRALTVLGMSTTLTPGTLTVDIRRDEIFVHALDAQSATDMRDGVVAERVAMVFEEPDS
ncbi:MAG TPA: Na+/H+ antiporter subunit E [Longimicrobiales bacterium]|nr:Na+/H+ antiporter subunit E [Longimicrobiales bacterium]